MTYTGGAGANLVVYECLLVFFLLVWFPLHTNAIDHVEQISDSNEKANTVRKGLIFHNLEA